jgi:curved DNA-binding protein CbpA
MDRCAVLQKAYDVLSNPKLRRTYDSVDEFDDSIPDDKPPKTEADFYKAPLLLLSVP